LRIHSNLYPMKELNRTDRLTIAAILFAVILMIGLITLKRPAIPYTQSIDETLNMVVASNEAVAPDEVYSLAMKNDPGYFLVDVRAPVDYQKSHIDHAVNIPVHDILNPDNMGTFSELDKDSKILVLYGDDQLESNGAWMMLKQIGINNIRVMKSGYKFYNQGQSTASATDKRKDYNTEEPLYNFKEFFNSLSSQGSVQKSASYEPVKVIKKEKKSAAEGGC